MVFLHEIDPSHSDDPEVQKKLQDVHDGVDVEKVEKDVEDIKKKMETLAKNIRRRPPPAGGSGRDRRIMC